MSDLQRLFIAFAPPTSIRAELANLSGQWQKLTGGRMVPASNLHLTLAFLGATPKMRIPEIQIVLTQLPPLEQTLILDTLGSFKEARVVWAGSQCIAPDIHAWVAELQCRLTAANLHFDPRPWQAHVTLLRKTVVTTQTLSTPLVWSIGTPQLFVSESGSDGPVYRALPLV